MRTVLGEISLGPVPALGLLVVGVRTSLVFRGVSRGGEAAVVRFCLLGFRVLVGGS